MPIPIVAAAAAVGSVGKVVQGIASVGKKIGAGIKKIFGGGKKKQAKKAAAQAVKAEKKIAKFEKKQLKLAGKITQQENKQEKAASVLSFLGVNPIAPVDGELTEIQETVFPTVQKSLQPEFAPYQIMDSDIEPLSRGDYNTDVDFVSDNGRKKRKMNVWVVVSIVGGVVVVVTLLLISIFKKRR